MEKKRRHIFWYFVSLLMIGRIVFFIVFINVNGQSFQPDSYGYWQLGINLANYGIFSRSETSPLITEVFRTPGYPIFLAMFQRLDMKDHYWAILGQEMIYLIAAFLFFWGIKRLLHENVARAALIFMLIEPGGLAFPKLILSEVFFLPFILGGTLAIGFYYRLKNDLFLILSGMFMGIATLIRPAALYLSPLAACALFISRDHIKDKMMRIVIFLLFYVIILAPWFVRNFYHFRSIAISGSMPVMLIEYHAPFVWESARDIPFNQGRAILLGKAKKAIDIKQETLGRPLNEMEVYKIYQDIALQELTKYPLSYLFQWFYGTLKTVGGSNLTEIFFVTRSHLDRLHFFDVAETNFFKKVILFVYNQDIAVLLEVFIRFMIAVFAIFGILAFIQKRDPFLWVVLLFNIYFLVIAGPTGYSRFRFPVEGLWFIQANFGYFLVRDWVKEKWSDKFIV